MGCELATIDRDFDRLETAQAIGNPLGHVLLPALKFRNVTRQMLVGAT